MIQTSLAVNRRERGGLALIELLVVLVLIGLVGGIIGSTLMRQEKFYRGANETLQAREGVRDAIEVLASDIRGLALVDTVGLMTDSAFEFFAPIGSSVACDIASTHDVISLPIANGPRGNTLSSFAATPDTGDIVSIYGGAPAKSWQRYRIASFATRSQLSPCLGTVRSASNRVAFTVRLLTPADSSIHAGAPVRFVRRGRYSLYRSTDGWYLGYRRCSALGASTCGSIQPLSGPYRPYSANAAATGLHFDYFDASGNTASPVSPLNLARVDIAARAVSRQRILIENRTTAFGDSASMSVSIRNRQ